MQADVKSIPVLRAWVAALKDYREAALETLTGIEMEIRRGIDWVEDQERYWLKGAKDCEETLWQAKQELNARKLPDWSGREPDTTVQERAVRRATANLEHCQEQAAVCRKWRQKLPKLIDETYHGTSNRLSLFLDGDLAKAIAILEKQAAALEAYACLTPDFAPAPMG